ncbi:hypothetical protein GcM3_071007 [Golovinomyces cichoracearum]|uniref:Uncharacterized protein n=1 Tax=Golovinomyces cichoracearum TaxID=62708 RepID=A0A420ISR1_9PEZI|nr:hypothetical protein GcM3_071007 [Golovinomyces cichoracearum]
MQNDSRTFLITVIERCQEAHINPPFFEIMSDRGRTAWSSTVTVQGLKFSARYWYDGHYVYNAVEDVAELALKQLSI